MTMRRLRMRRGALPVVACVLSCAPLAAQADGPTGGSTIVMPGVTVEHRVDFTANGPVAFTVIAAPAPTGLTTIGPVLAGGSVSGGRATLAQIEQSVSSVATVAGISGDFFNATTNLPNGIVMAGGLLQHIPTPARASIGFDANGAMRVARIGFSGTWQGSGQRRPINAVNQKPKANQTVLFTSAWGPTTPDIPDRAAVLLQPFSAASVNTDLKGVAVSTPAGPVAIPADGAVLVATGTAGTKLNAEIAEGATVAVRLVLPDAWGNVVTAFGGGPVLVKAGKAQFSSGETFEAVDLTRRDARGAIGQRADGRVLLVTVDGGRPGHSVGVTSYELAKLMVRLGAVTASGLEFGPHVTAAFGGALLSRPSDRAGARPIKEGVLVQYQGVYVAPIPSSIGKAQAAGGLKLSYRIVRPSTVTASVIGPDGVNHPLDAGSKTPGTYASSWSSFTTEGDWHWNVRAVDDLGRESTFDEVVSYDLTLGTPSVARSGTGYAVRFTLSRPAVVGVTITAANGTPVVKLLPASLAAGAESIGWDGKAEGGSTPPKGRYVVVVEAKSSIGTSIQSASFLHAG